MPGRLVSLPVPRLTVAVWLACVEAPASVLCAVLAIPCAWLISVVSAVTPLLAALMTWMLWPTESRRLDRSLAAKVRDWEAKNDCGLSRAELTFLPVARRCWWVLIWFWVSCSEVRLLRSAADSVTSPVMGGFLFPKELLTENSSRPYISA